MSTSLPSDICIMSDEKVVDIVNCELQENHVDLTPFSQHIFEELTNLPSYHLTFVLSLPTINPSLTSANTRRLIFETNINKSIFINLFCLHRYVKNITRFCQTMILSKGRILINLITFGRSGIVIY